MAFAHGRHSERRSGGHTATHRGAAKAFKEFGRRFARLSERGQRLVGADRADREAIGVELGEDDGADGPTEDWSEAGRVCQRMDDERA
jgi:hypothetical protein